MSENRLLGKYEILEELGRGGFGVVYKAQDIVLDVVRAVKVLHPALVADISFLPRFKQEARLAAKLEHPNLVPVYDFGEYEGRFFLAMKYMPGGSLKDKLQREKELTPEETLSILEKVGKGITFAHEKGIVHRDLKPGNILFDEDGSPRVSDMGFAKAMAGSSNASLSSSGMIVGTPAYIAPEIWRGKPAGPASDIYSLGCILYEMLTGKILFEGESPADVMTRHVLDDVSDLIHEGGKSISEPIMRVLEKALAKNPKDRFSSVIEFTQSIKETALKADSEPNPEPDPDSKTDLHPEPKTDPDPEPQLNPERDPETTPEPHPIVDPEPDTVPNPEPLPEPTQLPSTPKTRIPKWLLWTTIIAVAVVFLAIGQATNWFKAPAFGPQTRVRATDGMEQVYIPKGNFTMGSISQYSDEQPVHEVYLDAYWMDKFEVTNAQYEMCAKAGACNNPSKRSLFNRGLYYGNSSFGKFPVVYVNWFDANDYCSWAGGRLPTEAEWEKAARGEKDARSYPWGEGIDKSYANFSQNPGNTTMVGAYSTGASPSGVMDMAGNAWEWVGDYYQKDYYSNQENWINPRGPTNGEFRVVRGGSTGSGPVVLRVSFRNSYSPNYVSSVLGFRCVGSD